MSPIDYERLFNDNMKTLLGQILEKIDSGRMTPTMARRMTTAAEGLARKHFAITEENAALLEKLKERIARAEGKVAPGDAAEQIDRPN